MPMTRESLPQFAHRFTRPSDQALGIAFRVQHPVQIGSQRCLRDRPLFPATALLAYPLPRLIKPSSLHFSYSFPDHFAADSRLTGDQADPSLTHPPVLRSYRI